jgi:hypothetical protein
MKDKHAFDGLNCYLVNIDTADYYKGELHSVYDLHERLCSFLDFIIKDNFAKDNLKFIRLNIYKKLLKLEIITKDNFEWCKSSGDMVDINGGELGEGNFVIILEDTNIQSFLSDLIPRLIKIKSDIAEDIKSSYMNTVAEIGLLEEKLKITQNESRT